MTDNSLQFTARHAVSRTACSTRGVSSLPLSVFQLCNVESSLTGTAGQTRKGAMFSSMTPDEWRSMRARACSGKAVDRLAAHVFAFNSLIVTDEEHREASIGLAQSFLRLLGMHSSPLCTNPSPGAVCLLFTRIGLPMTCTYMIALRLFTDTYNEHVEFLQETARRELSAIDR